MEKEYMKFVETLRHSLLEVTDYQEEMISFKKGDEYVKREKFNNIFIIQGDIDKTVNVDNIIKFCDENKLNYKIIHEGKHELYGFDKEIVEFIVNN